MLWVVGCGLWCCGPISRRDPLPRSTVPGTVYVSTTGTVTLHVINDQRPVNREHVHSASCITYHVSCIKQSSIPSSHDATSGKEYLRNFSRQEFILRILAMLNYLRHNVVTIHHASGVSSLPRMLTWALRTSLRVLYCANTRHTQTTSFSVFPNRLTFFETNNRTLESSFFFKL